MGISELIGDNTFWIGIGLIGGFVIWKFIIEPLSNEGKPIEPTEEDIKTFSEKMQESMNPEVDF